MGKLKFDLPYFEKLLKARKKVSQDLRTYLTDGKEEEFVSTAYGAEDSGKHSGAIYGLISHGQAGQPPEKTHSSALFDLGQRLSKALGPMEVYKEINNPDIPGIKLGVGSELGLMVAPDRHYAINKKTLFMHLFSALQPTQKNAIALRQSYDFLKSASIDLKTFVEMKKFPGFTEPFGLKEVPGISKPEEKEKMIWVDAFANVLYDCNK